MVKKTIGESQLCDLYFIFNKSGNVANHAEWSDWVPLLCIFFADLLIECSVPSNLVGPFGQTNPVWLMFW